MTAVAIIPARGGSVRIPRKNIRMFHGKPIIAYSIETARESGLFHAIYVSTEDAEIADVAMNCGAFVVHRPSVLAEIGFPDCGTQEVTRHALMALNIADGYACCIYPCAPMLSPDVLEDARAFMLLNPMVPYVYEHGWFYLGDVSAFVGRVPLERGIEIAGDVRCIDINTQEDWARAEQMYAELHQDEKVAYG